MSRPVIIETNVILRAAREVFSEHGGRGTSAEIARRAGVSAGTVFKRFKTKAHLCQAAMAPDDDRSVLHTFASRAGCSTVEANLRDAANAALVFFGPAVDCWARGRARNRQPPAIVLPEIREAFVRYLEGEAALGRVKPHDAQALATAFFGMLIGGLLLAASPDGASQPFEREAYARTCAELFAARIVQPPGKPYCVDVMKTVPTPFGPVPAWHSSSGGKYSPAANKQAQVGCAWHSAGMAEHQAVDPGPAK